MIGYSHRMGAIVAGLTAIKVLEQNGVIPTPIDTGIIITGCIWGGYLPDIDTPNSHISQKHRIILAPVRAVQAIYRILDPKSKSILGHRGIAHTPFVWVILYSITLSLIRAADWQTCFFHLIELFITSVLVGVLSHLLLDMVFGGIMLLYPFTKRRIKLTPFATGGREEKIVFLFMTVILVYLIKLQW